MELFQIYKRLWESAQEDGAWVHYYTWLALDSPSLTSDPLDATGWFEANDETEDGQPIVRVYRLECDDDSATPSQSRDPSSAYPPPDLEAELITLAHEYGHLKSYRRKTEREEWHRYNATAHRRNEIIKRVCKESAGLDGRELRVRAALSTELDDSDRKRIVDEETLAWKIGRETLALLGLADFTEYDRRREQGLHAHRYKLGMDEAWPSDRGGPLPTE